MYEQLQNIMKMGPLGKVMEMMPGMNNIMPHLKGDEGNKRIKIMINILDSMTDEGMENLSQKYFPPTLETFFSLKFFNVNLFEIFNVNLSQIFPHIETFFLYRICHNFFYPTQKHFFPAKFIFLTFCTELDSDKPLKEQTRIIRIARGSGRSIKVKLHFHEYSLIPFLGSFRFIRTT